MTNRNYILTKKQPDNTISFVFSRTAFVDENVLTYLQLGAFKSPTPNRIIMRLFFYIKNIKIIRKTAIGIFCSDTFDFRYICFVANDQRVCFLILIIRPRKSDILGYGSFSVFRKRQIRSKWVSGRNRFVLTVRISVILPFSDNGVVLIFATTSAEREHKKNCNRYYQDETNCFFHNKTSQFYEKSIA